MQGNRLHIEVLDQESGEAQEIPIEFGTLEIKIGRERTNEVVLASPAVSRQHCRLVPGSESWMVVDLSSLGTILNGEKIPRDEPRPVKHGDVLVCANYEVRILFVPMTEPTHPTGPISQADPAFQTEPTSRTEPTTPGGPPPFEAPAPVGPVEAVEAVEAVEPVGPVEPVAGDAAPEELSAPRLWLFAGTAAATDPTATDGPAGRPFALANEGDTITFGRSAECNIRLGDPLRIVSSVHGRLERTWAGVFLFDSSTNGIFVNGSRMSDAVQLADGDRITVAIEDEDPDRPLLVFTAAGNESVPPMHRAGAGAPVAPAGTAPAPRESVQDPPSRGGHGAVGAVGAGREAGADPGFFAPSSPGSTMDALDPHAPSPSPPIAPGPARFSAPAPSGRQTNWLLIAAVAVTVLVLATAIIWGLVLLRD